MSLPSASRIVLVFNRETEKTPAKKTGEPRIAKGSPNYKLPSPTLLREGERSHKLDEAELKERARAIEEKCLEFDNSGTRDANQSRSVVTTFEFNRKPNQIHAHHWAD